MKDEPSAGRRRVDHLREGLEAGAAPPNSVEDLDQVGQGSPQAVELPHDQDIVGSQKSQGALEAGPIAPGAANAARVS